MNKFINKYQKPLVYIGIRSAKKHPPPPYRSKYLYRGVLRASLWALAPLLFFSLSLLILSCDDVADDDDPVAYGHGTLKTGYHAIILPDLVGDNAEYSFVISKEATAPAYSATSDAFVSRKLSGTAINLLLAWNKDFDLTAAVAHGAYLTEAQGALKEATDYHLYVYKGGVALTDKTKDFTTLSLPTAAEVAAAIPPTDATRNALHYSQQFYGTSIELSLKNGEPLLLPITMANAVFGINLFQNGLGDSIPCLPSNACLPRNSLLVFATTRTTNAVAELQVLLKRPIELLDSPSEAFTKRWNDASTAPGSTIPISSPWLVVDRTVRGTTGDKDVELRFKRTE